MKRIFCAFLPLMLCACAVNEPKETAVVREVIRIALPLSHNMEQSEQLEENINTILSEKVDAQIELEMFDYDDYSSRMRRNLARDSSYDILFIPNEQFFNECLLSGYLLDIHDLITQQGQQIIDTVGGDVLADMKIGDSLYAAANIRDYAVTVNTVFARKDLLEKYGFDPADLKSKEDLEKLFQTVHDKDPDQLLISSVSSTFIFDTAYAFEPPVGVLNEQENGYINLFETGEYMNSLKQIRRWYELGYIRAAISGDTVVVDSDDPFLLMRYGKPGGDIETSLPYGKTYIPVLEGEDVIPHGAYYLSSYALGAESHNPSLAMQVLSAFYTEQSINETLSQYMYSWTLPNQFRISVPDGYPADLWQQQKDFNEHARRYRDNGFVFSPVPVMKEYLAVSEIYDRYSRVLETGLIDPESGLAAMNEEMTEAGIERVIEEKNRQYQEWLNR